MQANNLCKLPIQKELASRIEEDLINLHYSIIERVDKQNQNKMNLILSTSLMFLLNLVPLINLNYYNNKSDGPNDQMTPPIGLLVEANNDAKRLYEDLMMSYNRFVRPVGNDSDTLILKMGLKLSQLIDVVSKIRVCGR